VLYDRRMRISLRVLISGIIAVFASLNLLRVATFIAFGRRFPSQFLRYCRSSWRGWSQLLLRGKYLLQSVCSGISAGPGSSIQIFGVALALWSLPAGFGSFAGLRGLIAASPGPVPIRSALAQVLIYPAQIVVAIWWLVLFNTRGVKEEFGVTFSPASLP
jgi:hypothetical protein